MAGNANDPKPQSSQAQAQQDQAQQAQAAEAQQQAPGWGSANVQGTAAPAGHSALHTGPAAAHYEHSPEGRAALEKAVKQALAERQQQMGGGFGSGGPPAAAAMGAHPFLGGILENIPEFVALVSRVLALLQGQGQGQGQATGTGSA